MHAAQTFFFIVQLICDFLAPLFIRASEKSLKRTKFGSLGGSFIVIAWVVKIQALDNTIK